MQARLGRWTDEGETNARLRILALAAKAVVCTRCALHVNRDQPALFDGATEPDTLFVGQSPGEKENETGVPFSGPSGNLLRKEILSDPAPFGRYAFTNAAFCYRPTEQKWQQTFATACAPFLHELITILDPRDVVAVGLDAQYSLEQIRARTFKLHHVFHPSYVLRGGLRAQTNWDASWVQLRKEMS